MSENKIKTYHLTADYKNSTYQTEQWNNTLSNGKSVCFEITRFFYWGTFEIELTDKQKEEILKKNSIILNDYGVSVESLENCCDYSSVICNEMSFTPEELKEIDRLLYFDPEDNKDTRTKGFKGFLYDQMLCTEFPGQSETGPCENVLEKNGWSIDNTIYGIYTGCKLEYISGDDE